ncbi:MAG: flagellar motor protein MotB [Bryobacterales bacterium]
MSEFEVQDTPPEGAPEWMVTFADLMSLLLTFFILLLSFSNMEIVKFRTMAGSVRNALGLKSEFDLADIPMGNKLLPYEDPKEGEGNSGNTQGLREELEQMLQEAGMPEKASVRVTSRGVALYIEGDILFDSGSTAIRQEARPILDRLSELLPRVGYRVDVQGHTDAIPIATTAFPSNWELSASRAGRAVRYFVEKGVPSERFRAIGLAETRPVATNDTAEGRANNRRVEFLFVNPPPVQRAAGFIPQVKPGDGEPRPGLAQPDGATNQEDAGSTNSQESSPPAGTTQSVGKEQ